MTVWICILLLSFLNVYNVVMFCKWEKEVRHDISMLKFMIKILEERYGKKED